MGNSTINTNGLLSR